MLTQLTTTQVKAALTAWCTAKLTETAVIKLFANAITYGPDVPLANFTEAAFTGYAPVDAVVVGVPDEVGDYIAQPLTPAFFQCTTAPDTPVTIYGFIIVDGSTLLAGDNLADPWVITQAGDYSIVTPVLTLQSISDAS